MPLSWGSKTIAAPCTSQCIAARGDPTSYSGLAVSSSRRGRRWSGPHRYANTFRQLGQSQRRAFCPRGPRPYSGLAVSSSRRGRRVRWSTPGGTLYNGVPCFQRGPGPYSGLADSSSQRGRRVGRTTPGGTLYNEKPPDAPDRSPTALTACGRLGASLVSRGSIMRHRRAFKAGRPSIVVDGRLGGFLMTLGDKPHDTPGQPTSSTDCGRRVGSFPSVVG